MKPNELRIGNLLKDSKTGALLSVSDISETGFTCAVIDRSKFPLPDGWEAMPVELTPEILEKCGFEKDGHWYHENISSYVLESNGFYMSYVNPEIKHLHQLQNLYFALIGEELNYQL